MVEFALVIPIVLLILFGIAYFGIALNDWIDETQITSEGAGATHPGDEQVGAG